MPHRRPSVSQLLPSLVVLLLTAPAVQASPNVEVPSDCGSIEEYEAGIRSRLGAEASALLDATTIVISRQKQGHSLDVRVGTTKRHIEDEDCRALFRAATVVAIAIWESPKGRATADAPPESSMRAVDAPQHTGDAPARAEVGTAASHRGILPPPLPAYVPEANLPGDASRNRRGQLRFSLHGYAGVLSGILPKPGLFLRFEPSIEYRSVGIGIGASYVAARERVDSKGYGVRVSAVGLSALARWYPHSLVGLHGGMTGYILSGRGKGSVRNQSDDAFAFGPQVGFLVRPLHYRRAWLVLGADAQLELIRPRFEILGFGEVFRPSWANGSAYIGIGFALD